MGAQDVGAAASAEQWLARCRAIVGGEQSRVGRIWQKASQKDRNLLLMLAGLRGASLQSAARAEWRGLAPGIQAGVRLGLQRFKRWADQVEKEAAE